MYLQEYPDYQLSGIGSKLKKAVKKVIKPVAHIGAAVLTGGASLAVSAAMINAEKQKKAQAAAQAEAIRQEQAIMAQINAAAAQPAIAPAVVTPSAGGTMPVTVAPAVVPPPVQPTYAAVQPQPQMFTSPSAPVYMTQPGESGGAPMSLDNTGGGKQPPWLIPAAIGAAVLLAMNMRGGRRQ